VLARGALGEGRNGWKADIGIGYTEALGVEAMGEQPMFIETCQPFFLRKSAVAVLSLFLCAPTIAQVPSTSTEWSKCELDCVNAGGGENLVKACKALCASPTSSIAGTMVPPSAVMALPATEAKPLAPAGKVRARREKRQ
jgi:hypothetical protein